LAIIIALQICGVLDVGLKPALSYKSYSMYIDDNILKHESTCRDLGVKVDQKLSFTPYICDIVAKAKQRMSLLLRSFLTKDPTILMLGFKTYVLPIVDYCSPVWSPHYMKDIQLIESVQRQFTKRIPCLRNYSYPERLKFLNQVTLERRRLECD